METFFMRRQLIATLNPDGSSLVDAWRLQRLLWAAWAPRLNCAERRPEDVSNYNENCGASISEETERADL